MKNKLRLFLCSLSAGVMMSSVAQNGILPNRGCGSGVLPQQFETWVQSLSPATSPHTGGQNQTMSVFNIPVVVHVIHGNAIINSPTATTGDNLSAAQIMDQINILNRDYNGLNTDTSLIPAPFKPVLGHFQFNFCMAVVNPSGTVMSEPGIDRIDAGSLNWLSSAPYSQNFIDGTIKPATIWDPTRYLNMWVCDLGGGLLGYATFPNPGTSGLAGLSAPYGTSTTDGLVMLNSAFGSIGTAVGGAPYNLGRTATHELGHWAGLRHVWGDNGQCGGTDYCNDTPPQEGGSSQTPFGANYGCPVYPLHANSCTMGGQTNTNGDMFMNYMDYVNDACMYMFTNDQKTRAQLIMTNSTMRASLLTSTVCSLPTALNDIGIIDISSPTYSMVINCDNSVYPILDLENYGSNPITSLTFSFNVDGINTQTTTTTFTYLPGVLSSLSLPTITGLSNGSHMLNVGVYSPNGAIDPNMSNNISSQPFIINNSFTVYPVATSTAICPGESVSLTVGSSMSGINYTWTPGGPVTSTSTLVVTPTATQVYTVTGTGAGCVSSATLEIVVGSTQLSVTASPSAICGSGSSTISASGATSYTWSTGSNSASAVVTPTSTTTYTVAGDNGGACSSTAVITITVSSVPSLTLTANPVAPICIGGAATLTAAGAGSYSWDSGSTGSISVVSPTTTTIYTVTGINPGCTSTETISVPVGTSSIALSILVTPTSVCAGGSASLSGSGANTYSWSTGDSNQNIVVHPTVTTVYSFDGSDGTCTGHASATVNVVPSPPLLISVNPSSRTVCEGNSATLTANGSYTNYIWNSPTVNGSSIVVTPTATVSYTVTGVDNTGCAADTIITLHVQSNPVTVLSTTNSTCNNPCTGAVVPATTGGVAPYTYSLSGGACSALPCNNLCPGLYTIYTKDTSGCKSMNVFSIANPSNAFVASVSFTNASCGSCHDGALHANLFSGIAPYHYSWFPAVSNGATADSLVNGCYTVTVTDSVGCMVAAVGCVYLVDGIKTVSGNSALLSVYPNPAKSSVTLAYDATTFDYMLYNHLGQLIASEKNNKNTAVINLENYAPGIYLIEADNGKEKIRKKLIVE